MHLIKSRRAAPPANSILTFVFSSSVTAKTAIAKAALAPPNFTEAASFFAGGLGYPMPFAPTFRIVG